MAVISSWSPPSPKKIFFRPRTLPTLNVSATPSRPSRPAQTKKTIIASDSPLATTALYGHIAGQHTGQKEPRHVADPAEEDRDADGGPRIAGSQITRLRRSGRALRQWPSHPA